MLNRAERERTFRRILSERRGRPPGRAVVGAGGALPLSAPLDTPNSKPGAFIGRRVLSNTPGLSFRLTGAVKRRNVANFPTFLPPIQSRKCFLHSQRAEEQEETLSQGCLMFAKTHFRACVGPCVPCVLCYYTVPYHQLVVKDIRFVIAGLPVMSFIQAWAII